MKRRESILECARCKTVIDSNAPSWPLSDEDYIRELITKGNALIDANFYCPKCKNIILQVEESTGLKREQMLYFPLWSVTCSHLSCPNFVTLGEWDLIRDPDGSENEAKKEGYRLIAGKWYCSDCCQKLI